MIEMELVDVRVEPEHNVPVVLLRDAESGRLLPIYIRGTEANAIHLALNKYEPPRPMTHDLFASVLDTLGAKLERVVVTQLHESTFYAELHLRVGERSHTVSSRPSDAIALAVRTNAPIFAAPEVLDEAAFTPEPEPADDAVVEEFRQFIDQVSPEDFA